MMERLARLVGSGTSIAKSDPRAPSRVCARGKRTFNPERHQLSADSDRCIPEWRALTKQVGTVYIHHVCGLSNTPDSNL